MNTSILIRLGVAAVLLIGALVGGALGPRPLRAQSISVRSNSVQEHRVLPGGLHEGVIEVSNPGTTPQSVRLYLTDFLISADGSFRTDAPGTLPRSNAAWIELPAHTVLVPPGAAVPLRYVLKVPAAGASGPLRGTYWSVIMVEPEGSAAPQEVEAASKDRLRVTLQPRYRFATLIAAHVGEGGRHDLRFASPRLVAAPGTSTVTLTFDVENSGERGVLPTSTVACYDEAGTLKGRYVITAARLLLPGSSIRQEVPLEGLEAGTYKTLILIDSGADDLFGAQLTLNIPSAPVAAADAGD